MVALIAYVALNSVGPNRVSDPGFDKPDADKKFVHYTLSGAAKPTIAGYRDEWTGHGVLLNSAVTGGTGTVSQIVQLDKSGGKWVTFRLRGRAEDAFKLTGDSLYMRIDFLTESGKKFVETSKRLIYREVLRDRKDFAANGNDLKSGAAVWRTYEFEELLPFPEVDSVRVTLGFDGGNGQGANANFFATNFELIQSETSLNGKTEPKAKSHPTLIVDESKLKPLGGRWYYLPKQGETVGETVTITDQNSRQLLYKAAGYSAPFGGNMTSWLKPGMITANGQQVQTDTFLPDNVRIVFSGGRWTIYTKNIPNHPIAKFPDRYGTQGYNPNYVVEQRLQFTMPTDPQRTGQEYAVGVNDNNGALNMGPIGVAVNGVIFFNPFDAGSDDASRIMDRCCGHPAPGGDYHYHKYPICVNTPFVDKGENHSPLIGFALDGFPVYGPYEREGVMARDDTAHPLNKLNAHEDKERGWHYHVSPGHFPYIIGGYMGRVNRMR
ncbi:MAG: YHYH protein [Armatimonadetes bacterium]|nr:YHYH protein [Armatimonadota bacterium]